MKRLLCGILTVLICLSGAAVAQETGEGVEWTFPVSLTALKSKYALLVNADHLLDKSFKPDPQERVRGLKMATSSQVYLEKTVVDALGDMFEAAAQVTEFPYVTQKGAEKVAEFRNGIELYVKSGYRSYGQQATIHANYLARNNNVDDGYVAKPGSSEHQSGLCADILNEDYAGRPTMTQDFKWTPEAQWMKQNCAEYGFILRFPEDKEDETGIKFEPWHFRYVGKEIAAYVMDTGVSFDQFMEEAMEAVEAFESAGGDVEAQLAYEFEHLNAPPETFVLDEYGSDGDAEISMEF